MNIPGSLQPVPWGRHSEDQKQTGSKEHDRGNEGGLFAQERWRGKGRWTPILFLKHQ